MSVLVFVAMLVGVVEMGVVDVDSLQTLIKRASVCYDKLGCFSTEAPFTSAVRPVAVTPDSPDTIGTKFLLFTREAKTTAQTLDPRHPETVSTVWTHFKERPTKFVAHGFLDSPGISGWLYEMKDELLKHGDYNVVVVDWSHGNNPPYDQASANTRVVGAQIALVINQLIKSTGITAASFHIIGHSLGSHVAGYAGERVPGLGRITGLDPAGPYFENTDKVVRLDPSDAVLVDNIHTDAKNLLALGFGMKQNVGHMDFYPNLGHDQPGCTRDPIINIIESGLIQGVEEVAACNHLRSIKYFTESINSQCPFLGTPCASEDDFKNNLCRSCTNAACAAMGFNADKYKPANGQVKYFLTTAAKAPFCRYHLDISLKFASAHGSDEKGTVSVIVNGDEGGTGQIPLTSSDAVNFSPGLTYKFYVLTPTDVGNVKSVTFSWSHPATIGSILGITHPTVFLDEIDVYSEEADAEYM